MDRVQYSKSNNQYYFFEFMEINNLHNLIGPDGKLIESFWPTLTTLITGIEKEKIAFISSINQVIKIFIFYQRGYDRYIKIENNPFTNNNTWSVWDFTFLQNWFKSINNIDGQSKSKGLGVVRSNNQDHYVTGLLQHIYNDSYFKDDNGLELTKALLANDTTKGFDLDLFQYIPSTKQFIIYEFLKRENQNINNIQAHPMRYSWTGYKNDNKQKFISLWSLKKYLNARLILVNYSDNPREKISLIEVLDMDNNNGITAENKYTMSRNLFQGWLSDMANYKSSNSDYFSDFKCVQYDSKFFNDFSKNKKQYGVEFPNIYI